MSFSLNRVGQIAFAVRDVDASEAFYKEKLGLRLLYRFGDLVFFDCCGVRLMVEKANEEMSIGRNSTVYFSCPDIAVAVHELKQREVVFTSEPHLIAKMEQHDLWMAFFGDPDGNTLALMQEAPKGYGPPSSPPALKSAAGV